MAYLFLVVDKVESESTRTVQQLRAAQHGAEVLVAATGASALALLEERKVVPSLAFLEFGLPDMSGLEFLSHIRQTRWLAQAPVAILANAVPDRDVLSCYRLGACAFLTKPVRSFELRDALRDFARPAEVLGGGEMSVNAQRPRFSAA